MLKYTQGGVRCLSWRYRLLSVSNEVLVITTKDFGMTFMQLTSINNKPIYDESFILIKIVCFYSNCGQLNAVRDKI